MAKTKINNKSNWKETSISWGIAEAIVGKDASHTVTRRVQLKVAYPLMFITLVVSVCIVSLLLIYAPPVSTNNADTKCQWEKCYCYDSFGRMLGHGRHCTVHGDGHECY